MSIINDIETIKSTEDKDLGYDTILVWEKQVIRTIKIFGIPVRTKTRIYEASPYTKQTKSTGSKKQIGFKSEKQDS